MRGRLSYRLRRNNTYGSSVRSYRTKIAEWGIGRPRPSRRTTRLASPTTPSDAYLLSTSTSLHTNMTEHLGTQTAESSHDPTRDSTSTHALNLPIIPADFDIESLSNITMGNFDGGESARESRHSRIDLSCACSCKASQLAALMQQFLTFWNPTLKSNLRAPRIPESFHDGVDNILHYAARFNLSPELYDRFFDNPRIQRSIHLRDCSGMTALEIAIRRKDIVGVKALLSHGACYKQRTTANKTMLHLSTIAFPSADITIALLQKAVDEGDTTLLRWYHGVRVEALDKASKAIISSSHHSRLRDSYRTVYLVTRVDGQFARWSLV